MPLHRKASKPVGITNESGQPEIVLDIEGLTISLAPPARRDQRDATADDDAPPAAPSA